MLTSSLLSSQPEKDDDRDELEEGTIDVLFASRPLPNNSRLSNSIHSRSSFSYHENNLSSLLLNNSHDQDLNGRTQLVEDFLFSAHPSQLLENRKRPSDYSTADLEEILLQPVPQDNLISSSTMDFFDSFLPIAPLQDLQTAVASTDAPSMKTLAHRRTTVPMPEPAAKTIILPSTDNILAVDATPAMRNNKKVIPMHELIAGFNQKANLRTPNGAAFQVRVLEESSYKADPLTPSFSKRVASKARESQNRYQEERQTYNEFLQRLNDTVSRMVDGGKACKKGYDGEEEDDEDEGEGEKEDEDEDDDDVFDSTNIGSGATDEDESDARDDSIIKAVSSREIFDLFATEDEELMKDVNNIGSNHHKTNNSPTNRTKTRNIKVDAMAAASIISVATAIQRAARFSPLIRQKIERQLNLHCQLLSQTLALAGEISGADQVWVTCLKLLIKLTECHQMLRNKDHVKFLCGRGVEMLLRILRQSPLHESLLQQIQNCSPLHDFDLRLRFTINSIPFSLKHKVGSTWVFSPSFWHILTIFSEGAEPGYSLINAGRNLTCTKGRKSQGSVPSTTMMNSLNMDSLFRPFSGGGRRNDSFLESEDCLLLLGLRRYGLSNWEKIQAALLPTRTAKQLFIRYKNLSARRAPSSAIKEFAQQLMQPLSRAEEELLVQGIRQYGYQWEWISMRFLPHRPPTILKRMWTSYELAASKPRPFLEMTFLSEDEEDDSEYTDCGLEEENQEGCEVQSGIEQKLVQ